MSKYRDCRGFVTAFGTSVPSHRFSQRAIGEFMKKYMVLDEKRSRWVDRLVTQSRINYRHSVIPDYGKGHDEFTFYPKTPTLDPFPSVTDRMACYQKSALPLATAAASDCLKDADIEAGMITHLITVSCTGMYAPGLDIGLVKAIGLRNSVERVCINFMGCYAAFNAMKVASSIVTADPSARVLVVCVELCSIHFQKQGTGSSHLLTNMLFGDGASAALIEGEKRPGKSSLALLAFASDLFPEGKKDMTWEISEVGFVMKLTSNVPKVLKQGVGTVFERLFEDAGLKGSRISHYAFHPGGPRVLEALEEVCDIEKSDNRWAYEILRDCGNMSSATIFFILQRILQRAEVNEGDLILSAAFGPGLTCETALMAVAV